MLSLLSLLSLLSSTLTLFVVCIGFSAAALQIYRLLSLIASLGPAKTTAITTTTTCDTHASLIYEACARTLAHCQMVEGEGKREKERNALSRPQLTQRRSSDRDRGTSHTGCLFVYFNRRVRFSPSSFCLRSSVCSWNGKVARKIIYHHSSPTSHSSVIAFPYFY